MDEQNNKIIEKMSDEEFIQYLGANYRPSKNRLCGVRPHTSYGPHIKSHDRLYLNIPRNVQFAYVKKSPIGALRSKERNRKSKEKTKKRLLRSNQYLRSELAQNQNIFLGGSSTASGEMSIQNALWDKNYKLKNAINQLKEENNSLKARAWNISKENRKMKRQIENWNLEKSLVTRENNKPYIDSTTMEKVFQDQDFSVVSMKIEINQLTAVLQERENIIASEQQKIRMFNQSLDDLQDELTVLGKQLFKESIPIGVSNSKIAGMVEELNESVIQNSHRIKFLQHQIQQTRNTKQAYEYQLEHLQKPVRMYSVEKANQIKQNSRIVLQEEEVEPQKQLERDITKMEGVIKNLEYKMQELINEGILQKQDLRKKIREAEQNLEKLAA